MTHEEFKEIAQVLKFEKINGSQNVITHGDNGNKFYIILKGVVSVQIPNPNMPDRALYERDFENIKKWMRNEFEPRVKIAKENAIEAYQDDLAMKQVS